MFPFQESFWIRIIYPFQYVCFLFTFTQLQSQSVVDRHDFFKTRIHVRHHSLAFSILILFGCSGVCPPPDHLRVFVILFYVIYPFSFSNMFSHFPIFYSKFVLFPLHPVVYSTFCFIHQLVGKIFFPYFGKSCFVSIIIIIIIYSLEFFTSALADGLSLEFE